MQFVLPTAAASLWTIAAVCLVQWVAWDSWLLRKGRLQYNVNYLQYLSIDAITLRKGDFFWWFVFFFICVHLSGSNCQWWIDMNWNRWSWRLSFDWEALNCSPQPRTLCYGLSEFVPDPRVCCWLVSSQWVFRGAPAAWKCRSRSFTEWRYWSGSRYLWKTVQV